MVGEEALSVTTFLLSDVSFWRDFAHVLFLDIYAVQALLWKV